MKIYSPAIARYIQKILNLKGEASDNDAMTVVEVTPAITDTQTSSSAIGGSLSIQFTTDALLHGVKYSLTNTAATACNYVTISCPIEGSPNLSWRTHLVPSIANVAQDEIFFNKPIKVLAGTSLTMTPDAAYAVGQMSAFITRL